MARNDIIAKLYAKKGSALDFNYDALQAPPLTSLIPIRDIEYMNKLVTSVKYNSKMAYKESEIKKVMNYYGFIRYACGTHRVVYRHLDIPTIITKISLNKTSLGDNIREMHNQQYLKPFCTKVFDVYPTGVIGLFERVEPFQSRDEFISVAGDIFDFINTKILGKYVVDDIGTSSFMNYGIRKAGPYSNVSFGPVLVDFTEVFPLDGAKLFCNKIDQNTGIVCGGTLDYDDGFNLIRCNRCGKIYEARELQQSIENNEVIKKGRTENMEMVIKRGNTIIRKVNSDNMGTDTIQPPKKKNTGTEITGRRHNKSDRVITIDPHASNNNAETKNIFCGGYVRKSEVAEPLEPVTVTEQPVQPVIDDKKEEYDTDTGFIPKQEEYTEPVEETEELGGDAESEEGYSSQSEEEISVQNPESELGDSSEPLEPEDELGEIDSIIDPAAIAAAMMSGIHSNDEDVAETNPFAK